MESWKRRAPLFAALVAGLVPLFWVATGFYRATWAALGRDQGIFQYVAWALRQGDRDYVDIREINGPLIHVVHLAFQWLGGEDERVFRSLDFGLTAVVYLLVGALAASLVLKPSRLERAGWALAALSVLGANYLLYMWWDQSQRESIYTLIGLTALALQIHAQRPGTRRPALLLGISAALTALTWFGKPTCLLFSVAQVAALLADDELPFTRKRGLIVFAVGSAVGAVPMIVFLLAFGHVGSFFHIVFGEVPKLYRHIWSKSLYETYRAYNNAPKLHYAFVTLPLAGALIYFRVLPRRALVLVFFLLAALVTFFVQRKGFPYHLHPVTAATHLLWIAGAVAVAERAKSDRRFFIAGAVGALLIAYQASTEARLSPAQNEGWFDDAQREGRESKAFLKHFTGGDFFAQDLRDAAAFLREKTRPEDRVQTYGMDPYVLFLARRRSATPFMYSFELNVDAAIEGASDSADRAWLKDTARSHAASLHRAVVAARPAAFVLVDKAPFTFPKDAEVDFADHCPETAQWMRDNYVEAARFGVVRVWLRR